MREREQAMEQGKGRDGGEPKLSSHGNQAAGRAAEVQQQQQAKRVTQRPSREPSKSHMTRHHSEPVNAGQQRHEVGDPREEETADVMAIPHAL